VIVGYVRDFFPRVVLSLPGHNGPVPIEFIVDTGFDGDLSLPAVLIGQVNASLSTTRVIRLADGSIQRRPYYEIRLDWDGEERLTEITALENSPLLGALLLDGFAVDMEMTPGGLVQIDRL
jgi:clan AA aspartic protease